MIKAGADLVAIDHPVIERMAFEEARRRQFEAMAMNAVFRADVRVVSVLSLPTYHGVAYRLVDNLDA